MNTDVVGKVGKRLKMIRVAAGAKQKDVAADLRIPAPILSMYESGAREPGLRFLEQFAKHFGIPLSQIFLDLEPEENASAGPETARLMKDLRSVMFSLERQVLRART